MQNIMTRQKWSMVLQIMSFRIRHWSLAEIERLTCELNLWTESGTNEYPNRERRVGWSGIGYQND